MASTSLQRSLLQTSSIPVLKSAKKEILQPFKYSATRTGVKFFHVSNKNSPCSNLCLLQLVLSPGISVKSLVLFLCLSPIRYLESSIRPSLCLHFLLLNKHRSQLALTWHVMQPHPDGPPLGLLQYVNAHSPSGWTQHSRYSLTNAE